jgi:hypothetical protein
MSLVVISLLDSDRPDRLFVDPTNCVTLLRLTNKSENLDSDSLWLIWADGRDLLATHYRHLFVGPENLPELFLDGEKHAQVAVRILEYLCDHPPHPIRKRQIFKPDPLYARKYQMELRNRIRILENYLYGYPHHSIPYRKRQTPKPDSLYSRKRQTTKSHSHYPRESEASIRRLCSLRSHDVARKMRLTANSFLRKRREEKHRHGMSLSVPTNQPPSRGLTYSPKDNPYALGLLYLPPILEQSSYSPELVTFIRGHATNIPFLQKTIEVIRAIHEYLDRSDRDSEEADVTQLRIKFAAMVIE